MCCICELRAIAAALSVAPELPATVQRPAAAWHVWSRRSGEQPGGRPASTRQPPAGWQGGTAARRQARGRGALPRMRGSEATEQQSGSPDAQRARGQGGGALAPFMQHASVKASGGRQRTLQTGSASKHTCTLAARPSTRAWKPPCSDSGVPERAAKRLGAPRLRLSHLLSVGAGSCTSKTRRLPGLTWEPRPATAGPAAHVTPDVWRLVARHLEPRAWARACGAARSLYAARVRIARARPSTTECPSEWAVEQWPAAHSLFLDLRAVAAPPRLPQAAGAADGGAGAAGPARPALLRQRWALPALCCLHLIYGVSSDERAAGGLRRGRGKAAPTPASAFITAGGGRRRMRRPRRPRCWATWRCRRCARSARI